MLFQLRRISSLTPRHTSEIDSLELNIYFKIGQKQSKNFTVPLTEILERRK